MNEIMINILKFYHYDYRRYKWEKVMRECEEAYSHWQRMKDADRVFAIHSMGRGMRDDKQDIVITVLKNRQGHA